MTPIERQTLFDMLRALPSDEFDFVIQRERVEPGKTFSEGAMNDLLDSIRLFVGARVMRRWDDTNEPPTALKVEVKVSVG